jgi:hypothetical protein
MPSPKIKCKCGNLMDPKSKQCSRCFGLANRGSNNPSWKGGRKISGGYIWIMCPEHPKASKGYVREHVLVMEQIIGRYLKANEEVHHLNMITTDNRPENLVLCFSKKEHYNTYHKTRNKATREKISIAVQKRWDNPKWKKKELERRNELVKEG